jgi:hypothetical protein
MDEEHLFIDPMPDSAWQQLPGGPVALDETLGEVWQYLGSARVDSQLRHEFRHRAHPNYACGRVYAHVLDDDTGPRLSRLMVDGREVPLADLGDGTEESLR